MYKLSALFVFYQGRNFQATAEPLGVRNLLQISHRSSSVLSSEEDVSAQQVVHRFIPIPRCPGCLSKKGVMKGSPTESEMTVYIKTKKDLVRGGRIYMR